MNILEEDSIEMLRALNKFNVAYILVGGLAVNYYGYSRTTGDVDLWLEDGDENRKKFADALKEYGIDGSELFLKIPFIAGYAEIMLDNGVYLDVMANLIRYKQADFQQCFSSSQIWEPEPGLVVHVLNLNQLIDEKEMNKRLKDQDDVVQLKRLREDI